jgi:hypothetical protein
MDLNVSVNIIHDGKLRKQVQLDDHHDLLIETPDGEPLTEDELAEALAIARVWLAPATRNTGVPPPLPVVPARQLEDARSGHADLPPPPPGLVIIPPPARGQGWRSRGASAVIPTHYIEPRMRFGRWVVTGPAWMARRATAPGTNRMAPVVCDCGTRVDVKAANLAFGMSLSCGCFQLDSVRRAVQS